MADDPAKPSDEHAPGAADASRADVRPDSSAEDAPRDRPRVSDFVRRAVSAGFEVASRSKDDIVRVATTEIRQWLDHLDLDHELVKALSKLTLEVKAEVRFRETSDGRLAPTITAQETRIDTKIDTKIDPKVDTKTDPKPDAADTKKNEP